MKDIDFAKEAIMEYKENNPRQRSFFMGVDIGCFERDELIIILQMLDNNNRRQYDSLV